MSFQPLDGPSKQDRVAVDTVTVKELKVGASALAERQVVTIQILDGNGWLYFGDGTTPSAATVTTKGFKLVKLAKESFEAGERQQLFIISDSGTINITFTERA